MYNQMKTSQEKRDGNERKRGSKTSFKTKFQYEFLMDHTKNIYGGQVRPKKPTNMAQGCNLGYLKVAAYVQPLWELNGRFYGHLKGFQIQSQFNIQLFYKANFSFTLRIQIVSGSILCEATFQCKCYNLFRIFIRETLKNLPSKVAKKNLNLKIAKKELRSVKI